MNNLLLTKQPARRGFLRSLVMAPVAALATHKLILPAQAIVQPDKAEREFLLDAYNCWLDNERRWLAWERAGCNPERFEAYLGWTSFVGHRANSYHCGNRPAPSSRALTVLASVGCDWRESEQRT